VLHTGGTDTKVQSAGLVSILLSNFLSFQDKKIIYVSSPTSGYDVDSLAVTNITVGLYSLLEKALPGGVYVISSERYQGRVISYILPALAAIKHDANGFFTAPDTGPVLTIIDGRIYQCPLLEKLRDREKYVEFLLDLSEIYLEDESSLLRLEQALESVSFEDVSNPVSDMDDHYQKGKRVFIVQSRGLGNGPEIWREKIREVLACGDTTVMVIADGEKGDANLKAYQAGLYTEGVLSGRTLRRDIAWSLGAVIHDLKMHGQLNLNEQAMVNLYCYLSGMIDLTEDELRLLLPDAGIGNSTSYLIYPL
jgi:L-asparaginase/Glu-tRNA(Gln) amidotransferase subunit D